MLARLLGESERIDAMAFSRLRGGGLVGTQRLVVATSERLLLVEKGLLTGRERRREVAWADVRGETVRPPAKLDIRLAGETIELSFVQPPDQLAALADTIRLRTAGEPSARTSFEELRELGRRKLPRMLAFGSESLFLALVDALGDREAVLDLAYATVKPEGLLAVTSERLVFVPAKGVGAGPLVSVPFQQTQDVAVGRERLTVTWMHGELAVEGLAPPERAAAIGARVRARARM